MKNFKKLFFLASLGLMMLFVNSASAREISKRGWLFDFESGLTWSGGSFSFNKNYNSSLINLEDEEHNNVLKMPTENLPVDTLATVRLNNTIEEKDYVLSFEFCALQENARYVTQWWTTDGKVITCFTINNNGVAGFSKTGSLAVDPPAGITQYYGGAEYEVGKWHTVEMAVDLDSKTRYYYLDGEYLGECTDTNFGNGLVGNIAILHGSSYVKGEIDSQNQAVYIDNFKVTYKNNVIDDVDFEKGIATIQNNESQTIGIQNKNLYMSVSEENDGNKVGSIYTNKSGSLSEALINILFNGVSEDSPYRMSFRYKHTSGSVIDFVPVAENKERMGYFRICEDGNLKIVNNWNYLTTATTIPSTSGEWHTMDVLITPESSLCEWYLDGVKVKEIYYNLNEATGALSGMTIQAIGTEDMVLDKTPVLLIDDIEAENINGTFFAEASVKGDKINLKFNEYPNTFDASSVTVKDSSGNAVTVKSTETSGKCYTINLNGSLVDGEHYIVELPEGITSVFGNGLNSRYIGADALPSDLEFEITPLKTGGIFTDKDNLSFEVTVTSDNLESVLGIARVVNEKGEYLWNKSLDFNTSDTITLSPDYENEFGSLYFEVSLKYDNQKAWVEKKIPFSVIFSNGVKNEDMGICNHYSTRYETKPEDFDKEVKINTLAGFGINREEFQWDRYEKPAGTYALTQQQRLLFDTLNENGLQPFSTVFFATWAYGREEGDASEFMPIPVTDYQRERYAEFLKRAVKDTKGYNPIYEIGNEWNLNYWNKAHKWADGTEVTLTVKDHYIPLMKTAYNTIKSENENAKVVGLAVGNIDTLPFIEECLLNGAAEYCDYISIHPYSVYQSPEDADIRGLVESVRELLKTTSKPDMPIIFSEWGWTSAPGVLTEEEQAAYSVRGAALVEDSIESLIWYNGQEKDYIESILEQNFGFVNGNKAENPLAAKPVFIAMSCYNSLVGDKIAGELLTDEEGTYKRIHKGIDKNIIQIWNPEGNAAVQIADDADVKEGILYDMYGNSQRIFSENGYFEVEADSNPCYLEVPGLAVKSAEFSNIDLTTGFDVNIINNSSETKELTVFIASYKEDGRLLDVEMNKVSVKSGFDDYIKTKKITVDDNVSLIKGFLWDEKGTPIISKTLTIGGQK